MAHDHAARPELARSIGRAPEARTITAVEVVFRRGEGCCEADPVRPVAAYYSTEGSLLAERDLRLESGTPHGHLEEWRTRWATDLTETEVARLAQALADADYMNWRPDELAYRIAGTVRAIASSRLSGGDGR